MPPHPRIKHIVTVMMENRSFDHVLGFLKAENPDIRGILGNDYFNETHDGTVVPVTDGAAYQGQLTRDPGHDFESVYEQMYGAPFGGPARPVDMSGFARSYERQGGKGADIMRCFRPEQLPVITELARQYAVCDQWFSSVPGPTLPNRAFAHFGTSFGRLDMSPDYFRAKPSIYQRLHRAGMSGRIYYFSSASSTMGLSFLLSDQSDYFGEWGDFLSDCRNNDLPEYSFIEPNYSEAGASIANDQHPDHSVREGDHYIRRVYEAIRSNGDVWTSTVLLIVWDEHGGIYDHEIPPAVTDLDGFTSTTPPFLFDRLGVRVPAVVVSPYVEAGTVDHVTYEHASILATVTEQFIGDPLTKSIYAREQHANTFRHLLTRDAPRGDMVTFDHLAPHPAARPTGTDPASSLHRDQVAEIYAVLRRTHPLDAAKFDPDAVKTEADAADFVQRAMAIIAPG
jgi:phospholipase C